MDQARRRAARERQSAHGAEAHAVDDRNAQIAVIRRLAGNGSNRPEAGDRHCAEIKQTVRKLRDASRCAQISRPTIAQSEENRENRFSARPYGASHRVFARSARFSHHQTAANGPVANLAASVAYAHVRQKRHAEPVG